MIGMKWIVVVAALAACKGDKPASKADPKSADPKVAAPSAPATPKHVVPSGTVAGKPFAPTVIGLYESSDGGKLALHVAPARELRDRKRCEEPIGSGTTAELTRYEKLADWKVGAPISSELANWGGAEGKGTAKVTLSKKDAKTFAIAGTIELAGDGWKLSGPFEGEYCPTKGIKRETAEPLAGVAWSMKALAAPPSTPLTAVIAGAPSPIAHVTVREVPYDKGKRQRLTFWAALPPDPCEPRPDGGHTRNYDGDKLVATEGPEIRIDNFTLDLAAVPTAGAALAGRYTSSDGEQRDQILDADLQAFEPDGFRGWRYAQYYSAALAVEAVTDTELRGRVVLALPDDGKSMLAGAFTAKRCPPMSY